MNKWNKWIVRAFGVQFSWERLLLSFFRKKNWCTEKFTNLSWVTETKWQNWDWIKVCWTEKYVLFFPFFFFYTRSLTLYELRSSMKQPLQSYLSISSKDTSDYNYPWQNSPFDYKLLLLVCLWSKLGGICSEDMEGELMETAHKSSTFGNAIIYRLAYFRSAQFWFH